MTRSPVASAILAAACLLSVPRGSARAGPVRWPPDDLAARLAKPPKTDLDKTLKKLIADYQGRIGGLVAEKKVGQAWVEVLHEKLRPLYLEYNRNHKRYRRDHFTPAGCIKRFESDMGFALKALADGKDPATASVGRWQTRVAWIERTDVMGHFDLIVPRAYDPKKPSPLVISYQDDPDMDQMRSKTPYFVVRCIQKGYPTGLTYVENKTRTFLKAVAREYNIDPFRIYATGFSYGGKTDLILAWRYPHWFAAIAPICNDLRKSGGGRDQTPHVKYLKNVPTLLMHGTGDSFLRTGKIVHQYMKEAGCPVEWMTYPGGHSPTLPFREDVTVLTKFFDQHVMDPYPKTVSHVVEHMRYSRAFWVNAKLTANKADMAGTFEVRVKDGNRIEIDANDQIAEIELDLTAKLVDMKKPVTVVSGDKTLYEGPASAKLLLKLRDGEDYPMPAGDRLWEQLLKVRNTAAYAQ